MRRLSLMFIAVAALAGCSSGSSDVADSTPSSSPSQAASASGSASPSTTSSKDSGGRTPKFCAAFKQLETAKSSTTPAEAATALRSAATDMRATAPASIKAATASYADLLDKVGRAAQSDNLDEPGLQKELAQGMTGKAQDIATVAIWVSTHCHA